MSLFIQPEIFEKLPNLKVFIATAKNINLQQLDKDGCKFLLESAWNSVATAVTPYPNVQSHPNIAAWRKAYNSLGISVKKYSSSIENLAKRAAKNGSLPRSINPLVDFYNAVSLKFLVPFGGFDLDDDSIKELSLRFTANNDTFCALDSPQVENLQPGEAVYATGSTVVTRHINWKQSKEGLITDKTINAVFMAEILADVPENVLDEMKNFFETECKKLLKVDCEIFIATQQNNTISYI